MSSTPTGPETFLTAPPQCGGLTSCHVLVDVDEADRTRRVHVLLSAMWGVGLLVEVAIRLTVIAHLSIDAANAVNSAITLPVVGLLVVATIAVGRRSAAPSAVTV